MQSEQRRHRYLNALGITSWLPRTDLPGARASAHWVAGFQAGALEPCDPPEQQAEEAVADGLPTPRPMAELLEKTSESAPVASSLPATVPVVPATVEREARVQVAVKPSARIPKAPRFRLCYWAFDGLLIIDTLPNHNRNRLAQAAYQKLAENLARALGYSSGLKQPPYVLAWPMLAGARINQGPEVAAEAVQYKLRKLLSGYQPRALLLLGESAARQVMSRNETLDELRGMRFSFAADLPMVASLSLTQMLQIPECKKEVWVDLQALVTCA